MQDGQGPDDVEAMTFHKPHGGLWTRGPKIARLDPFVLGPIAWRGTAIGGL